jgi:Cu/Ag efflux pump CusA
MVENIFRHMVERSEHVKSGHGHFSLATRLSSVLHASSEVSRGIFFAAAIIIASFLPLFTLTGVEGHIFGPMAKTYAYAILGGLIATFTIAPVLATMLLPDELDEVDTWLVARIRGLYACRAFCSGQSRADAGRRVPAVRHRDVRHALAGRGVPSPSGGRQHVHPRQPAGLDQP